ncbi:hypothetical protein ACFXPI_12180 [Streptomyces sp. NPDC059104]|uniref:hypothetical protein n=1 Tax=Streptomyces sp. NPDC059104 TaxID=3346729 RepID=UPI00367AFC53
MSRQKLITRIAGMIAAGIAMVFLAGGPAHAGTATVDRTVFLSKFPSKYSPSAFADRDIWLNAGTYTWQVKITHNTYGTSYGNASTRIYLAAGNYRWSCEINPDEDVYQNFCSLTPSSGEAAWLASSVYKIDNSGDYTLTGLLAAP